ncbi:MAG: hypothetical protein NZ455_08680 [Bacteroidia bacterium]|nr:hypothetical protein [Bacteroidia bacterium]MDW8346946.1 hypothetical protein [Bacteroidia bacterium]
MLQHGAQHRSDSAARSTPTRAQARDTPKKVKLFFRLDIKYVSQQSENCFLFSTIDTIMPSHIYIR